MRGEDDSIVEEFIAKMQTQEAKEIYKERGTIGEPLVTALRTIFDAKVNGETKFNILENGDATLSGKLAVGSLQTIADMEIGGNLGIGTTSPDYTLKVVGTAWVTSGAWTGSDLRWKKHIVPLNNSLDKITKLQGVNFEWKREEFLENRFPNGTQVGLIAQDVEKVIPEVITTDNNGYKGISYEKLVPVLIEAIKEQQEEIEALKAKLIDIAKY